MIPFIILSVNGHEKYVNVSQITYFEKSSYKAKTTIYFLKDGLIVDQDVDVVASLITEANQSSLYRRIAE